MNSESKIKCPKCGDDSMTEITATWGTDLAKKIEIYCNSCGQISIVQVR